MTRILGGLIALTMLIACGQQQEQQTAADAAAPAPKLDNRDQKFSYSAGVEIGERLRALENLHLESLQLGLEHAITESEKLLSAEDMAAVKAEVYKEAQEKRQQEMAKKGEDALTKGKEFLAANASKEGVKTTASGLQYTIVEPGKGKAPTPTDAVVVHYRGTLLDGTEFDSSYKRGKPAEFQLNGVIPGWTEGLQLVKPGGKAKLFIPPQLAYGARGAGNTIGPHETLIFDVELVEVKKSN